MMKRGGVVGGAVCIRNARCHRKVHLANQGGWQPGGDVRQHGGGDAARQWHSARI